MTAGRGARAHRAESRLAEHAGALRPALLEQRLTAAGERLARATPDMALIERVHMRSDERLQGIARLLGQLDPDRPLERGFARLTSADGDVLMSAAAARAAGQFTVKFADDAFGAIATDAPPPKKPRSRTPKPAADLKQESLF